MRLLFMRPAPLTPRQVVLSRPHRARAAAFAGTLFTIMCVQQIGCAPVSKRKRTTAAAPATATVAPQPMATAPAATSGPPAGTANGSGTSAATSPAAATVSPAVYIPPPAPTSPLPNDGRRLTHDKIRSIARESFDNMSRCYSDALARDPQTQGGRINVVLAIADDGAVLTANAQSVEKRRPQGGQKMVTDPQVRSCVENHFKSLRFPPTNRGIMNMIYPVDFSIE